MGGQPEGFKLMQYQGEKNGEIEWVWNSRDRITPFVIMSQDRTQKMQHVRWEEDAYAPGWVPRVGDRVFVDLTIERARELRRTYVERAWDVEVYGEKMSARWATKEAAIEELAQADFSEYGGHGPDLVVVDEAMHRQLAERSKRRG